MVATGQNFQYGVNPDPDEQEKAVATCSMHPKSLLFQIIGLLFICSIGFGNYFCYDGPGALEVRWDCCNAFIIDIVNNYYIFSAFKQ